jgi:hypothetical protein
MNLKLFGPGSIEQASIGENNLNSRVPFLEKVSYYR